MIARHGLAMALLAAFLAGCTVAPDTLCQSPRPAWHLNDTYSTRMAQKAAAATWDSRCTLLGAWRR